MGTSVAQPGVTATVSDARRRQMQARMQALGVSNLGLARLLAVNPKSLDALLKGRMRTYSRLGYDQWAERVSKMLDGYEQALPLVQEWAKWKAAELEKQGLPIPAQMAACLPAERRGRRKGGK